MQATPKEIFVKCAICDRKHKIAIEKVKALFTSKKVFSELEHSSNKWTLENDVERPPEEVVAYILADLTRFDGAGSDINPVLHPNKCCESISKTTLYNATRSHTSHPAGYYVG